MRRPLRPQWYACTNQKRYPILTGILLQHIFRTLIHADVGLTGVSFHVRMSRCLWIWLRWRNIALNKMAISLARTNAPCVHRAERTRTLSLFGSYLQAGSLLAIHIIQIPNCQSANTYQCDGMLLAFGTSTVRIPKSTSTLADDKFVFHLCRTTYVSHVL